MICNQYIMHCLAKLVKSSFIKERTWINQRKTYAKGIFVNKSLLFVHIQPTEFNLHSHFIDDIDVFENPKKKKDGED